MGLYQVIFLGKSGHLSFTAVGCLLGKLLAEGYVVLAGYNESLAIIRLSALLPSPLFSVVWQLSLGSQEKQFRFRQSFQSALPMSGSL